MPIHDWTRVTAGTFHAFHLAWIAALQRELNRGILPAGYYALAEQVAGDAQPDVLTLQQVGPASPSSGVPWEAGTEGGIAVKTKEPHASIEDSVTEAMLLAAKRRRIAIRHATGDRVVALIELVSVGNKDRKGAVEAFVDKAVGALEEGYHVLLIDLFPPGPYDPAGMHGAVWRRLNGQYTPPADRPLTLAAYQAADGIKCYVEPRAVGDDLVDLPLFLSADRYVDAPLRSTYAAAFGELPERWRAVLE